MPYGGIAIPMYDIIVPARVNISGSATWSTVSPSLVVFPTSEVSAVEAVFQLPDTYKAGTDVDLVATMYKNAAGTQAVKVQSGYYSQAVGAVADVANTSYTTLGDMTAVTALSATTKQVAQYKTTITGSAFAENRIIVAKVVRDGNSTLDAYGDSIVLMDIVLKIQNDDMGEPV